MRLYIIRVGISSLGILWVVNYKWVANRVLIAMETTKVGMCKRCSSAFEYTGEMPDECGDCNTVYFD